MTLPDTVVGIDDHPGDGPLICVVTAGANGNRVSGLHPFFRILGRHWPTYLLGVSPGEIYPPFRGEFGEPVLVRESRPGILMLARIFCRIRGDAVVCFQYDPFVFFAAYLSRVLRGKPLCLMAQDWDLGFAPAYPLRSLHRLYSLRHEAYYRLAEKLARSCDLVVTSTRFLQRRLGGMRIPQGSARVVSGDSLRNRGRVALGVEDWEVVVMWVGRPRPWKGLEELELAVSKVGESDPTVRLVVVGPGHGKEGGARYTGYVPRVEVPSLVSACDIYAVTPRMTAFSDTQLPTKIFDGMAAARPVVATRLSDIPRVLGRGGVYAEGGDTDRLAELIIRLAGNPKERKKIGLIARKIFRRWWSEERMEERLVPAIRRMLG